MNLFNKLPGFVRSAPGLEHLIWRRLPAILLWGTLLPLGLAALNRAMAPPVSESGASAGALLLWDYTMFGVVVLHWTMVLTLALACFIVRVMKGPAYVADAYPFPQPIDPASDDLAAKPDRLLETTSRCCGSGDRRPRAPPSSPRRWR